MISEHEISSILECALSAGGDFAELFFEDRRETGIKCSRGIIQSVKSLHGYGAGLYLLNGTNSVYVYTNNVSLTSLLALAKQAGLLLEAGNKNSKYKNITLNQLQYSNPNPIILTPSQAGQEKKMKALTEIDKEIWSSGMKLLNMEETYSDYDQEVMIANSEGLLTKDRRIYTKVRFNYAVGDEKRAATDWHDYTKAQGFEALSNTDLAAAYIKEEMKDTLTELTAEPLKSCRLPVVIEAGNGGTLWHETCGHSLEATAISKGQSAFVGKLGQKVASERVTLIDDGTLSGLYGTSAVDDEGHKRQENILIENGILKQYLCDRLHGRRIGMESNGCGRRQNYTYAPVARMSNTYLAPGKDDEEEMISSLGEGLYVKSLGGGTGGMLFSIAARGAYLIKNGKIDRPVKNVMLTGSGIEVIQKVDRVGRTLKYDMGGFCGAASGLLPTTTFQPRVRISEMVIGGGE